jgi:hypothetical protein
VEVAAVVGGPALYLFAHALFRLRLSGSVRWRRPAGALACVATGLVFVNAAALTIALLVLAVLVAVIARDQLTAARRSGRQHGEDGVEGPACSAWKGEVAAKRCSWTPSDP